VVCDLVADLQRPDVSALLIAGVAPAWFNVLELSRIHEVTDCPVLSISFERSAGLAPAIRDEFDGEACRRRLASYEALPPRYAVTVNDEQVFVRAVGIETGVDGDGTGGAETATGGDGRAFDEAESADDRPPELGADSAAARIVRRHTPEGGRPEPLRVARLAARAGREYAASERRR